MSIPLKVMDESFRGPFTNANRWFLTCVNQPQFKAVLGEVQLCAKMAQFDGESDCNNPYYLKCPQLCELG